jgi:ABC-type molybdate transport system substrate-binding protein
VLLNLGAENPAAQALLSFLNSTTAKAIISRYGYDLPQ